MNFKASIRGLMFCGRFNKGILKLPCFQAWWGLMFCGRFQLFVVHQVQPSSYLSDENSTIYVIDFVWNILFFVFSVKMKPVYVWCCFAVVLIFEDWLPKFFAFVYILIMTMVLENDYVCFINCDDNSANKFNGFQKMSISNDRQLVLCPN